MKGSLDHSPAGIRLRRGLPAPRIVPWEVRGTDCVHRIRVDAGCARVPIARSGRSP